MLLLVEAVFIKPGSYVISPKSSSLILIFRRSIALIVSWVMGTSYVFPVRLSVMVRVSDMGSSVSYQLVIVIHFLGLFRYSSSRFFEFGHFGFVEVGSSGGCVIYS